MFEEFNEENDESRLRRTKTSRLRSPRAAAARSGRKKVTSSGFGGKHRRRNKHWSW
jgi:hypothetical protein